MSERYPIEELSDEADDGTMPANVERLGEAVIGRKIVSAEKTSDYTSDYTGAWGHGEMLVLTLDDGTRVKLAETSNCCAYTDIEDFLLHVDKINHAIMGVGTTSGYTKWHIYADLGDVLELTVGWSPGNPFYYGYGFDITVEPATA